MSNTRVLIVEDDEDLVHMLQYNLNRRGYQAIAALNGLSAWQMVEKEKPDLVLLDIMLPGMDGWQICKTIRSHGPHQTKGGVHYSRSGRQRSRHTGE